MVTTDKNLPKNIAPELLEQIIVEQQDWLTKNKKIYHKKLVDK